MMIERLQQVFPNEVLSTYTTAVGEAVAVLRKDKLHDVLAYLNQNSDCLCEALLDLCGVDYLSQLKPGEARFEVVYQLYSYQHNHRLRLRVKIPAEDMTLPSATDLWVGANWFEREAFDMFGFQFAGHPHLKRILMFEGFEGHPLRKDYPIEKRQKIPFPQEIP